MNGRTILVVDDEQDILELVRYNLDREGYAIHAVDSGEAALAFFTDAAADRSVDLIVLDLMLPGLDGMELCRRFKRNKDTGHIPIIMLTAKGEDSDIVSGLEVGADDYISKPFSPRVLTARVRALLRRNGEHTSDTRTRLRVHDIAVDTGRHEVSVQGQPVHLSATEFAILVVLAEKPGWVYSRAKIIDAVKGKDYAVTERSVDVQILGLRRKLGSEGRHIETVRGVGYRMTSE